MKIKKGQLVEVEITDIAFGGRGITRIDGLAVFVDGAVPGDTVSARIFKKKKNYAEARVVDVLSASPDRITPPCPYSGVCGGCKWQYLSYEKQLIYKRAHVVESLAHIAGVEDVTVHPTIASDRPFGYRNKMEFTCSDWRWLMPDEMGLEDVDRGFALGLHVPGTFFKVLDTRTCLLHPDPGNAILHEVRKYIRESDVPVYGLRSQVGFWRFVMLRHSRALDRWMVNIVTFSEDRGAVEPLAKRLMAAHPEVTSVVNNITASKAGVAIGEREILLGGDAFIREKLGAFQFDISANSFFQTNTRGAERLYKTVSTYAGLTGSERVVDLYCGAGAIAIWLSPLAESVVGLEISEVAVADAWKNCRANNVDNCRFITGDIKESLARIEETPDVMIIDPPRVGMHKDVVAGVLKLRPPKIVYVSCNPATLARDLGMMKEVYKVREIQPVDMFPHTFHIEAAARLDLN
ncbi:MAG: 23S rRNA (uracil(1939)-C(5))-methyltransferase RlmD [Desulfobacterales bacterium]|nr:23S rRNA (uracil(1939)-C(5))-methyltransferase RlmD [Desulfobacterales bacterium]